ncbi:Cof-type HAD-IIB family hydrolase [Bacillus solimangrovi]|uniref:Hydrolase n=1 Tax=Bacillus solimangrovi TaxID=1305675 RepID=A0A1E5LBB4_9BACI|nr:Cof-type HAD-IIB family hydrolase [Bacillus solimangrovi]OEH91380.1 hydrolase [Bacillus solimangrovi]
MIKCIALDMDGTLVNSELTIHDENAKAIKLAQDEGIEVLIVTGRSYAEAKDVLQSAGIVCPIICVNGSEIRDETGKIIEKVGLDVEKFQQVRQILTEENVYFEVYSDQGTYTSDFDKALTVMVDIYLSAGGVQEYEQLLKGAKARFENGKVALIDNFDELLEKDNITFYKLLAFSFDEEQLTRARERVKAVDNLAVSASGKENIEITSVHAQKGIALEKFTVTRGLKLEHTMAVGDNYNDVSMFEKVGYAVGMGNAPDEVKSMCDATTLKNDEHGVAKAILDVLENQKHS